VELTTKPNPSERLCDLCGERPAAVEVTFVAGGQPRRGALCEQCARTALAAQHGSPLGGGMLGSGRFGPGQIGPGPGGAAAGAAVRQRPDTGRRSGTPALDKFGRDLTAEARGGRIDPVIGRQAEIEQVVEALSRRRKNNAALIGEAGVGKTAIAEGLALRIVQEDVPEPLRGTRVVRPASARPSSSRHLQSCPSSSTASTRSLCSSR
jgi:ATP-dependent Clp protease ATP-binding subunit ClpC